MIMTVMAQPARPGMQLASRSAPATCVLAVLNV